MTGNIFISYRRSESPKDARALYERLRREFGEQRVFIDLEGIEPGEDFVESLERQLGGCEVLVALIGRDWAEAKNERGERRLDDENDFVRIELRTALRRGIRVIPVLIDGCAPPSAQQLPDDLQPLVRRQAVSLDFHKFDTDVGRLVAAIRRVLEAQPAAPRAEPTPPAPKSQPAMASFAAPPLAMRPRVWLVIAAVVFALVLGLLVSRPRQVEPREDTEPIAASAVARNQETMGGFVDDSKITTEVKAKFVENKDVAASSISVETLNGTVQLFGFAKNTTEKATAESLARGVKGVRSVKNDILVRP